MCGVLTSLFLLKSLDGQDNDKCFNFRDLAAFLHTLKVKNMPIVSFDHLEAETQHIVRNYWVGRFALHFPIIFSIIFPQKLMKKK